MHDEVLSGKQRQLLPLIKKFSPQFGLVGGTAIALQLGHRRSIDFDLFSLNPFEVDKVEEISRENNKIEHTFISGRDELSILVNGVRVTFYYYPHTIKFDKTFKKIISLPDLLTLGAMKGLALGKRAKWKDYVDLYFIFKSYGFKDVASRAEKLFGSEFNEKLFRVQLGYFEDIDYSEQLELMPGFEVDDGVIKERLMEISLGN